MDWNIFWECCIPKLNQSIADLGLAAYLSKNLSISIISPNQSNAEIPIFTPPAGIYTTDQTITLSTTTEGATIYYTLDGTMPTSLSTVYKVAIPITGNGTSQTIKAIAIKAEVSSQIGVATLVQSQTGLYSYATFMAIDPSGRFAIVGFGAAGVSGDKIVSYSIDQHTGILTQVTVKTASNAQSVSIY